MSANASQARKDFGSSEFLASQEEMERTLRLFLEPGAVFEIRALKCRRKYSKAFTISGYFDDPAKAAKAATECDREYQPAGIYFLLNPVKPELMARSPNGMTLFPEQTTGDIQITKRRWLLIDFDPKRESGIASTDSEMRMATSKAKAVREYLTEQGWPDPIRGLSGNGGHLLYAVDLNNDEAAEKLIRSILNVLADKFSDSEVEIDRGVYNPARLCRLFGSVNRKGGGTADRPHRLSKLFHVPEKLQTVSIEALRRVAGFDQKEGDNEAYKNSPGQYSEVNADGPGLNVGEWLSDRGVAYIRKDKPTSDGRTVYELKNCLFHPEHGGAPPAIMKDSKGQLSFHCHHDRCSKYRWQDIKQKIGAPSPEHYMRDVESSVDDDGTCRVSLNDTVEPFPLDVFPKPVVRFVREVSQALPCPPDFIALPVIALSGSAIGTTRVIQIKKGWRESPRIFTAGVGDPGSKKSPGLEFAAKSTYARQKKLKSEYDEEYKAYKAELEAWEKSEADDPGPKPEEPLPMKQVFTTDSTIEALAELLDRTKRGIAFIRDELSGWCRSMNQYKSKGSDREYWLSFWSGAPIIVNRKNRKNPIIVTDPFVCVAGCIPPDVLEELADERGREDGFIHRILFGYPNPYPVVWTEEEVSDDAINGFIDIFDRSWMLQPVEAERGEQVPMVVTFTSEGKKVWVEWISGHQKELADPSFPENLRGPWAKMEGYCARLALILQELRLAAQEAESEQVDEQSVAGSWALIHYFKSHARRVYARLRATPEDMRITNAINWIRKQGGKVKARDFLNHHVAGVKK